MKTLSRLSFKIPALILTAALIAGIGNGLAGLIMVDQEMSDTIERGLENVSQGRAKDLGAYFGSIEEDLVSLAASPLATDGVQDFARAWNEFPAGTAEEILQSAYITDNPNPNGEKENLDKAPGDASYDVLHGKFHPAYRTFLRTKGYYDIFLFDLDGNLLYSVFKELDYATNLNTGQWKDSGLGEVFRAAAADPREVHFIDFAPYEPSYGAPASFISTGIYNRLGQAVGVLAFQMPIERINELMQSPLGLRETGDTAIVGADGLRRSDSRFATESGILKDRFDIDGLEKTQAEGGGYFSFEIDGVEKIGQIAPFDFHGTRWSVLAYFDRDEAFAASENLQLTIVIVSVIIMGVVLAVGLLFSRSITTALGGMIGVMGKVADGDYGMEVPNRTRADEVGDIARALDTFRANGAESERLRTAQENQRLQAEKERVAALMKMAETVERDAGASVDRVAEQTTLMGQEAEAMAGSAEQVEEMSQMVAAAAQEALANVEAVSASTEELAASIQEIGSRVTEGAQITQAAVTVGEESRVEIESLLLEAEKIGEVATLIGDIAEQTNLLALNATIEAARAGDAGKGFAVVASEVKNLAGQTGRATGEISAQIQEIQRRTKSAVDAVQRMVKQIADVDSISTAIAAAIEQQQSATQEIARNVTETAMAARDVAQNIERVSSEAESSRTRAGGVRTVADAVHVAVEALKNAVIRSVRTASDEVDRRESERKPVSSTGSVRIDGKDHKIRMLDISDRGTRFSFLDGKPTVTVGATISINCSELQVARSGTVRDVSGNEIGVLFAQAS
ncbi:MAG: methyl-accepting chemotaxis protein [Alphaproteobacteria bacterium]|nr:methyl-accepting chemotaxis protein [Alphaproteobacteria bacterium]